MNIKTLVHQAGDPRWLHFYLQRRIMNPKLRDKIADAIARHRNEPVSRSSLSDHLKDRGMLPLGVQLSADRCEELRSYFSKRMVKDLYRPEWPSFLPGSKERHPLCHVANHSDEDIVAAPHLMELANDPLILDTLHAFFGCRPIISYIGCWWSYPTSAGPQQAENFHRDVDDWRFIKLFVYLTDVTEETGPHAYALGSASSDRLARIARFSDEEVCAEFGRQSLTKQMGCAGTAFLENTFGLHKGTPVGSGTRLLFQVVYSLHRIPYGPRRPVASFDQRLTEQAAARDVNRVYFS